MAEEKKSFVAYCDWIETFEALPDDKAGQLAKHLFRYVNDLNPNTDDILINAVFANIKQQLKRDLKKWEGIREKRSDAGKASAESRKQKATNSTSVKSAKQKVTNSTVSVNANVNVNDNVIKEYSSEIKNFTESILNHFPIPPKKIESWYEITDKLVRIDKYDLNTIETIVKNFRADSFWIDNFQSYTKLRKKKDEGLYIDYFKNILISKNNGANQKTNTGRNTTAQGLNAIIDQFPDIEGR